MVDIEQKLVDGWRWLFKQTRCRLGWHDVYINTADIDPSKCTIPAHCINCGLTGNIDRLTDIFIPDKEQQS